jgi:hypothetical protein
MMYAQAHNAHDRLGRWLLTECVNGLENYADLRRALTESRGTIKVSCDAAAIERTHTAASDGHRLFRPNGEFR